MSNSFEVEGKNIIYIYLFLVFNCLDGYHGQSLSFPGHVYTILETGEVVGAFQPAPLDLIVKREILRYIRQHNISTDYVVGNTWPIVQYKLSVMKENISSLPLPSSVIIDL